MVETRSKTKADLTAPATEVGRVQRERRERSPRGARLDSATTTAGSSALPDSASIQQAGTVLHGEAQPGPAFERPDARAITRKEADASAPPKCTSVHSRQSCSEATRSSRSSATVRAQKLALEADALRRQVERERELARQQEQRELRQAEREFELARQQEQRERQQAEQEFELARQQAIFARQQVERESELTRQQAERASELARQQAEREHELARLEYEAEQTELQARLAALEASDKSAKSRSSCISSRESEKRTQNWVLEQSANMTTATRKNMPGVAPTVTLGNPLGHFSQPVAPTNTVSFFVPNVNRATHSKPTTAENNAINNSCDNMAHQPLPSENSSDSIAKLAQAINSLSHKPKKPELATFSGDVGQWMAFKSSYERTKSNFSPSENLDRLNNVVRGPAYQSVASLLWTSGDPDDVMHALEQTYARPELLVAREVAELRNSPKLSSPEDLNNLANKLRNFVMTLKLLKQNEYLCSPELFRCIMIKLSEHTRARFTDFASVYEPEEQLLTKLELLSRFLLTEADKQLKFNFVPESTVKAPTSAQVSKFQPRKETVHATLSSDKVPERCSYCKQGPHNIKTCKSFLALTLDNRWRWIRESKVCYRCLKSNPHTWNNCRAKRCGVDGCSRRHNALLHGTGNTNAKLSATPCGQCNNSQVSSADATSSCLIDSTDDKKTTVKITNTSDFLINATGPFPSTSRPRGLLKVVPIVLEGPDGALETTALLDEGSTATLIDGEVAARIGAKPTCQERLRIEGVSGMTKEVEVSYVDFYIRGRNQPDRYQVNDARAIKPLGLRAQNPNFINLSDYDHLTDLTEELSHIDTPPTVLIGAPDWHLSLSREVRCGRKNEPVASRTLLGWVLHGALSVSSKPLEFVNHTSSDDLDALIKSQYNIDALGITRSTPCLNDDDKRAIDIIESSARQLNNGHFEVALPWKLNLPKLIPDSYPQALSRFKALERQMARDSTFAAAFQKFIDDIICKEYAEECDLETYHQRLAPNSSCTNTKGSIRWYLPIFGVFHPQKKKLRAVHDAAAVTKGISLNSLLLQGPDLLSSLLDILFRFREGEVALNADIKEMFPQVKISARDRDAQRFLWRGKDGNLKEYRMSSMIFGAVSSPFIALYIKNKNAKIMEEEFPDACKAITEDHYMDDYLGSHFDIADAARLAAEIVAVHKAGGFEMRAWVSNRPDALSLIPKELRSDATSDVLLPPSTEVGVLGVKWNPRHDSLGFRTLPQIPTDTLTKRSLLSNVMKVYDPLGLLMPVVIWGRILIQRLWRAGIGWDTPLPEVYNRECEDWFAQLQVAANIKIPRWYMNRSDVKDIQLHVVADGGEQAFACVAYWRFSYSDGTVSTALIGSKARVSPLKPVSIPRLELQAALIASRYAQTILHAHRFQPSETVFWTDSTTVLKWIRSDARAFKAFVAHRLGEILETTNPSNWRWIPTSLNVADDATKPKKIKFTACHRWFTGPQFLLEPSCTWPTECVADEEENSPDPELKSDLVVLLLDTTSSSLVPDPTRFSSWLRLLRATARIIQGARLFRLKLSRLITPNSKLFTDSTTSPYQLHAADIVEAEKMVVRQAQAESFPDELTAIRSSQPVPKNSRILKLAPRLDRDGLMRLDTRISSAPGVSESVKSPIILDGRNHSTRLLILHEHNRASHHFNELVLNELRQKYWILRARNSIRSVAHACTECRRWKSQPAQPQIGNLPLERLDHHKRPFTHVGLDYFGAVLVTRYRRHEKRYVALYTCLVTRALHLEIVASLSSDAAIMSLRRFIARRGSPTTIFSDNGTNFVGASRELRCLHNESVREYATNHKIEWRFIPPASPFMGGAWERLVRTVKTALKSCLSKQPLKEDVLATLLLEAEAIVNSRPLTYVPTSPDSPEAITPFHFILGTSSVVPWTSTLTDADLLRRCDWRKTLRLADKFWARWVREYLPTLRPRGPTTSNATNLGEGDVVLIADPSLPRGLWPLGRIAKVFLGPDGAVRVADVHTKGGLLRRPARKLFLIQAAPQSVATG